MSRNSTVVADGEDVAANRVRFLAAQPVEPGRVRAAILASWRRSRLLKVHADKIELPYNRDPDPETLLARTAEPVLQGLRERLDGQSVSIILTDQTGLLLTRLTGDNDLERHLDRVMLAPGFSYSEKSVGTNGIGTALEMGAPAHVFGHEHYAENLESLGCAGVPIQHPISGRTVGVLDLTCWRRDAGPLLLTLARTTAEQIRQGLLAEIGAPQLELFQEYLRTCRRTTGVVFALNDDLVMMNDYARSVLDPADQAALLQNATEALVAGRRQLVAELPSGSTARIYVQPVRGDGRARATGVVHVRLGEGQSEMPRSRTSSQRMPLPGVVGAAPTWLRACDEIDRAFGTGEWIAVAGESGVGKLALLRATHLRREPAGRFVVFDAAAAVVDPQWLSAVHSAVLDSGGTVVLRHADRLDQARLRTLAAMLGELGAEPRSDRPLLAVTLGPGVEGAGMAELLRLFPSTVDVPPLRLHLDDLPLLVGFFLNKLSPNGQLVCSPEAMQLLRRASWPGNTEQVHQTLYQVTKHRRSGVILPDDLPPETRAVSRRLLSPLESVQRDAIISSLTDSHGDKGAAARTLGMSRATIYRKIHEYGIVVPGS